MEIVNTEKVVNEKGRNPQQTLTWFPQELRGIQRSLEQGLNILW